MVSFTHTPRGKWENCHRKQGIEKKEKTDLLRGDRTFENGCLYFLKKEAVKKKKKKGKRHKEGGRL